ncbi:unnamed protein product [Fusarium graminearum]|uniref:Chromosome 1, complete genome n=1 Tax=Gibberella zeae (strain ATCC MYA-4620 / CBS 123657 / FGSC 9075 / NRRL 31084 / PH-1) TaxID=229533 RepID=A0A098DB62_GIBZE|nr:unnamed protein product [Fusarium graminearum]
MCAGNVVIERLLDSDAILVDKSDRTLVSATKDSRRQEDKSMGSI